MTVSRIVDLLKTEQGRAQVVEMMTEAITEIDSLCSIRFGFPMSGNISRLLQDEVVKLIADGVNLRSAKANERKPYNDD